MNRVLIVWEIVPEETKLYALDADQEDTKKLAACHGKYEGVEGCEEVEAELDWLSKRLMDDDVQEIQISDGPVSVRSLDLLIHTGFLL